MGGFVVTLFATYHHVVEYIGLHGLTQQGIMSGVTLTLRYQSFYQRKSLLAWQQAQNSVIGHGIGPQV